jgi:hypothetical protein
MDNKENNAPSSLLYGVSLGPVGTSNQQQHQQQFKNEPAPSAASLSKGARLPLKDITHLFDPSLVRAGFEGLVFANAVATTRTNSHLPLFPWPLRTGRCPRDAEEVLFGHFFARELCPGEAGRLSTVCLRSGAAVPDPPPVQSAPPPPRFRVQAFSAQLASTDM